MSNDEDMRKRVDEMLDSMTESGMVLDEEMIATYKAHTNLVWDVAKALLALNDADTGMMPNPMRSKITADLYMYAEAADGGLEVAKRLKVGMTPTESNQAIKEATNFIHKMYVDLLEGNDNNDETENKDAARQ